MTKTLTLEQSIEVFTKFLDCERHITMPEAHFTRIYDECMKEFKRDYGLSEPVVLAKVQDYRREHKYLDL